MKDTILLGVFSCCVSTVMIAGLMSMANEVARPGADAGGKPPPAPPSLVFQAKATTGT